MLLRLWTTLLCCICATFAIAAEPLLLPRPNALELGTEMFKASQLRVWEATPEEFAKVERILTADGGLKVVAVSAEDKKPVRITGPDGRTRTLMGRAYEEAPTLRLSRLKTGGYTLRIHPMGIDIAYGPDDQLNAALTTLRQLAWGSAAGWAVPCGTISDTPRYAHRGYMLDESRHFTGKAGVKRLLDAMELLKLNVFHWHLTDEPGWRIEIKKYPKLTTIGALGNHTDKSAAATFYTQDDVRELVAYAEARGIAIIPEIDMPGHAAAANRAYPEFSGGGSKKYPDFTFNPAKAETDAFLKDILAEVRTLFPKSSVIHLGGDEVHFGWEQWPNLPEVQKLMAEEKFTKLDEVEGRFVRRMADHLAPTWSQVGLWDEASRFNLPKEKTLLFWWRHDKPQGLKEAADKGYDIILCPRIPLYFDFVQDAAHKSGRRWAGKFAEIQAVHAFPESLGATLPANAKIRGLQANLWTETAVTQERRDFLTFPRLLAVSEAAWTQPARKDFTRFTQAQAAFLPHLEALGLQPWKGGAEVAK